MYDIYEQLQNRTGTFSPITPFRSERKLAQRIGPSVVAGRAAQNAATSRANALIRSALLRGKTDIRTTGMKEEGSTTRQGMVDRTTLKKQGLVNRGQLDVQKQADTGSFARQQLITNSNELVRRLLNDSLFVRKVLGETGQSYRTLLQEFYKTQRGSDVNETNRADRRAAETGATGRKKMQVEGDLLEKEMDVIERSNRANVQDTAQIERDLLAEDAETERLKLTQDLQREGIGKLEKLLGDEDTEEEYPSDPAALIESILSEDTDEEEERPRVATPFDPYGYPSQPMYPRSPELALPPRKKRRRDPLGRDRGFRELGKTY